jgi:hypothetical protein
MTNRILVGPICAVLVLSACVANQPLPTPAESPSSRSDDDVHLAPRTCPGVAPEQGRVAHIIGMLGSRSPQTAQFAFDALQSILESNPKTQRTLVCYLDDQRPMHVDVLLVLTHHPDAIEDVAMYRARTVFAAIALALGSPPPLPGACSPGARDRDPDLKRCLDGWWWHLDQES